MRISYDNYIDYLASSAMTSVSVITNYPLSNVQDQRLGKTFRSSELSTMTVIINIGDIISAGKNPVSTIALLGHNLDSSATVTVERNIYDSWPGATSQSITYNSGIMLSYISDDNAFIITEEGDFLISEESDYIIESLDYYYYRFTISNTTNADSFIELGRIWLGDYLNITPSSLLNFNVTKRRSDIVIYGKDRQKFALEGVGWRHFSLSFPVTDHTMVENIIDMYKTVGNHTSIIFSNFDTLRGYDLVEPCYVSIVGDIVFSHKKNMKFEYSLELEEDL